MNQLNLEKVQDIKNIKNYKLHDLYPEEYNYNYYPESYIIKNISEIPKKVLNYIIDLNHLWLIKPINVTSGSWIEIY